MFRSRVAFPCQCLCLLATCGGSVARTTEDAAPSPDLAWSTQGGGGYGEAGATGGANGTGGAPATGGSTSGTGGAIDAGGDPCTTPPEPSPLLGWAAESSGGLTTTTGGNLA